MLIQMIVTGVAAVALGRTLARFRKSEAGRGEFAFWILFWIAALVFVWNPNVTNILARVLGVGRGADAVFYLSIILVFYAILRLYGRLETLEHQLSQLVKTIALKDLPVKSNKQDKMNNVT